MILFNTTKPFYRNPISGTDLNSPELTETTEKISLDHAGMTFRNWCFDGFRLANNQLQQEKETTFSIKNTIDAVKIYFNRRGQARLDYRQLSKSFCVGAGQFNMLYSAELDTQMSHFGHHSEMFSLQITRDSFMELIQESRFALDRFARQVEDKQPVLFSDDWMTINTAMDRCINDIVFCPFSKDLKQMYLRSKATELFILFVDAGRTASLSRLNNHHNPHSPYDREKLYFAREYLIQNYTDPITLPGLARLAGLNEFQLKRGFRQLFDTSVIDFLITCRLEQAREKLLHTNKTISEIAFETGYASPGYFSKAFKKKYGTNPSRYYR